MTRLVIVWVGPIRSRPIQALAADYLQRIRRWVPCEVREVPERPLRDPHQQAAHRRAEAAALRAHIRDLDTWVVLTPSGEAWSTERWLQWWTTAVTQGWRVGVVLGGPMGLSPELEQEAPYRVALAPITMSHEMTRAVFLELMYRILSLWKGTPYAK
ncbi:Ribosomal RNA large subunit methyltransferase H [bacterium HR11]|nr:Ribosomal RNA large subunit methyltransferase H [bacterium HR11]